MMGTIETFVVPYTDKQGLKTFSVGRCPDSFGTYVFQVIRCIVILETKDSLVVRCTGITGNYDTFGCTLK